MLVPVQGNKSITLVVSEKMSGDKDVVTCATGFQSTCCCCSWACQPPNLAAIATSHLQHQPAHLIGATASIQDDVVVAIQAMHNVDTTWFGAMLCSY